MLNSNLEGVVLDNRYYAGGCLPYFIQDVRFRKPYNVHQYTLEASLALTPNTTAHKGVNPGSDSQSESTIVTSWEREREREREKETGRRRGRILAPYAGGLIEIQSKIE